MESLCEARVNPSVNANAKIMKLRFMLIFKRICEMRVQHLRRALKLLCNPLPTLFSMSLLRRSYNAWSKGTEHAPGIAFGGCVDRT